MSKIRQTYQAGKKLYSAKDVYTKLGLRWHGQDSLPSAVPATFVKLPTVNVDGVKSTVSQIALDEAAIRTICKTTKKDVAILGFATAPRITINLPQKATSVKLKANIIQVEARRQIRKLVQDYATVQADLLKITGDQRKMFFELSYKALYNAFGLSRPDRLDLKALAEQQTKLTGRAVSGLLIAEQKGLAVALLQFAQTFYK